jgi:murein DD-endopeptidase MepM/ murein hydrolase activator NlpD
MAIDPKDLTIDYRKIQAMPFRDRKALVYSSFADQVNSALTPSQRANLFPNYYVKSATSGATPGAGGDPNLSKADYLNRARNGGVSDSDLNRVSGRPEERGPPQITASEFRAVESNPFLAGYVDKAQRDLRSKISVKPQSPKEFFGPNIDVSKLPAGMRNNNPGNLKFNPDVKWEGLVGPSENTDQGDFQAVFNSPLMGMRATAKLLTNKYKKYGLNTFSKIIQTPNIGWTPGASAAQVENAAKQAGFGPNDVLDLDNPEILAKVMRGIIAQEHGPSSSLYSDDLIKQGIALSSGKEIGEERTESIETPNAMAVVERVASEIPSATELKGTTVMGEKGTEVLVNEKGYALPVTSKMMHEGHGRTSEFGYGRGRLHAGVDLYATNPETGNLVVGDSAFVSAPISGKVTMVREDRGRAGNYIEIKDKNGISHRFLHTARTPAINPNTGKPWQVGETIEQGQTVTTITGSGTKFYNKVREFNGDYNAAVAYFDKNGWGDVNKPHLHYETRRDGKLINPAEIFPQLSDKKTTLQFANIEDRNKHLLATGQISQKQYDEAMSKPEVEKIETTTENLKENKIEPEIKKPLSIIDYSRTEDAKRKPVEVSTSNPSETATAVATTSSTTPSAVPAVTTAAVPPAPESTNYPIKTMAQGGIIPKSADTQIVQRNMSGDIISATKVGENENERMNIEPISKMSADALTVGSYNPVEGGMNDSKSQSAPEDKKVSMKSQSVAQPRLSSDPYSNIQGDIKPMSPTAKAAMMAARDLSTQRRGYSL